VVSGGNDHSKYRWNEELAEDSKLFLEQNVHLLQDCFDGIDINTGNSFRELCEVFCRKLN
jgi:hypothetical protein